MKIHNPLTALVFAVLRLVFLHLRNTAASRYRQTEEFCARLRSFSRNCFYLGERIWGFLTGAAQKKGGIFDCTQSNFKCKPRRWM